ncbi:MAG: Hpt domain-containing protein [Acidobacteriaceae bacterium]|nr:Hpt domain-containing protein [Acidobacteriaceae bacterium]MBV9501520.1 Hpt domain-containing protein [Acidobacteriaceae bacterium]
MRGPLQGKGAKEMNLRVLLVGDSKGCEEVSSSLLAADYTVLPARDLNEASEAISLQKFDVVLLERSIPENSVAEFAAKLRGLEKVQESYNRTPIFCLADGPSIPMQGSPQASAGIDGYFSKRMDSLAFTEAVMKLACAVPETSAPTCCADGGLPVFELEAFQAQVGHDHELFMEIIELFLAEQESQAAAMRSALTLGDFGELGRVAHTIKGSLASLHAIRSRTRAQELESAAKSHSLERCQHLLNGLEAELKALEHELQAVRATIG